MKEKRDRISEAARKARYKDREPEYGRRYREKHKEAIKARRAENYRRNKAVISGRGRRQRLKADFGITEEDYNSVNSAQGGLCAICREPEIPGRHLAVDHDHESGTVRGLLCLRCNTGLGQFRDSPDLLDRAACYISAHQQHLNP